MLSVGSIYNKIANDFSVRRAYVWQCVKVFLEENKHVSSIIEAGCGNGKNLILAKSLGIHCVEGFDNCDELLKICSKKGLQVFNADITNFRSDIKYDIVLSIAVIHHLEREEERLNALETLLSLTKPGGKIMITVWSHEKGNSRVQRNFDIGDNLVSWRNEYLRFYYIYNETNLHLFINKFLEKHPNVTVSYDWEQQNWIVYLINN